MSDSNKPPKLHPANEVIAKLYSTVVDNTNMLDFFTAWDTYAEHVLEDHPEEAALWQPLLINHFEQASSLVVVKQPSMAEEKQAFVDRQPFPAVLLNQSYRLVARNQRAGEIWPIELDSDVAAVILPPFDSKRALSMRANSLGYIDPILVSLEIGEPGESNIVIAVLHPVEFSTGDGKSKELLFILRIAQPRWYAGLGRMLSNTYGLTESEVEIARALHQNKALSSIAEERQRSIRTVRTQLSQVFEKTGTSSQTQLISMITNLGQILDVEKSSDSSNQNSEKQYIPDIDVEILTCRSSEGHQLSYAVFGHKSGLPVLSVQPTVPPEMTERFRQAAVDAGLRFIIPYKPGSGQSSSRNYSYKPKLAAKDFKAVLDAEGIDQISVLGIYSGGVYALEFANSYPAHIKKIVLADTGVPLKLPTDFLKMSPSVRRTFLPARLFPTILLTPHKMVAKDFHESEAGQQRIVNYFFKGSPSDLKRVRSNKEFYNITRDMIRYSFEDIKQLVDDVCLWASDWKETIEAAAQKHELVFLHGEHNDVFMWEAIDAYTKEKPGMKAVQMTGNSQLGIFVEPSLLMQLLNE